jgi:hypothetical protein
MPTPIIIPTAASSMPAAQAASGTALALAESLREPREHHEVARVLLTVAGGTHSASLSTNQVARPNPTVQTMWPRTPLNLSDRVGSSPGATRGSSSRSPL